MYVWWLLGARACINIEWCIVPGQSNVWASVVSGRSRAGSIPTAPKPIPGTTSTLPSDPALPTPTRKLLLNVPPHAQSGRKGSPSPGSGDSMFGNAQPRTPQASGQPAVPGGRCVDPENSLPVDDKSHVKFFLDNASSAGSMTSTESGFSEHRPTNNSGSYADACRKASAVNAGGVSVNVVNPGGDSVPRAEHRDGQGSSHTDRHKHTPTHAGDLRGDRDQFRNDHPQHRQPRGRHDRFPRGRGNNPHHTVNRGRYEDGRDYYDEGQGWQRQGGHYGSRRARGGNSSGYRGKQTRSEPALSVKEEKDIQYRRAISDRGQNKDP